MLTKTFKTLLAIAIFIKIRDIRFASTDIRRIALCSSTVGGLIERIRQQGDTLGEMMNTAKWGLADVCHQMGRRQ